jgi:hypothetical protein
MFFVRVLDPLINPSNVISTVSILVELAAGQDFEVGMYRSPTIYTDQSGPVIRSSTFTNSPAEHTMSESVSSIKQLISRANTISVVESTANFISLFNLTTQPTALYNCMFWQRCFAFWRGSTTFHLYSNQKGVMYTARARNGSADPFSSIVLSEFDTTNINLPYYNQTPVASAYSNPTSTTCEVHVAYTNATTTSTLVQARYGDDAQFYYFLGPPQVRAISAAQIAANEALYAHWADATATTTPAIQQLPALLPAPTELPSPATLSPPEAEI